MADHVSAVRSPCVPLIAIRYFVFVFAIYLFLTLVIVKRFAARQGHRNKALLQKPWTKPTAAGFLGSDMEFKAAGRAQEEPAARRSERVGPERKYEGSGVLSGEKILITGPAGRIGFALARFLAAENEVWGIARFTDPSTRAKVDALGVTTRRVDLATGEFGDLPKDFTYALHLAADFTSDDYEQALRVNAEGTGFLLEHCRRAKAALVMSTLSVYKPHADPWHRFTETDTLGDAQAPPSAPYSVSKIAGEALARYCVRSFGLPVTIARMGTAYGEQGGLPVWHLDAVAAGEPVRTRWDPMVYSPTHEIDICAQLEPLLHAASVPATTVNWCGDEAVSVQQWAAFSAELLGLEAQVIVEAIPGASIGVAGDPANRTQITGPCRVSWRDGFRLYAQSRYPDRVRPA